MSACPDCTERAKGLWHGYSGSCEACVAQLEADAAEHRKQVMECLARHVLSKPTRADRAEWLQSFEARNGKGSADPIRAEMTKQWAAKAAEERA